MQKLNKYSQKATLILVGLLCLGFLSSRTYSSCLDAFDCQNEVMGHTCSHDVHGNISVSIPEQPEGSDSHPECNYCDQSSSNWVTPTIIEPSSKKNLFSHLEVNWIISTTTFFPNLIKPLPRDYSAPIEISQTRTLASTVLLI